MTPIVRPLKLKMIDVKCAKMDMCPMLMECVQRGFRIVPNIPGLPGIWFVINVLILIFITLLRIGVNSLLILLPVLA